MIRFTTYVLPPLAAVATIVGLFALLAASDDTHGQTGVHSVTPTDGDEAPALQALFAQCADGDTILLQSGTHRISRSLVWTGTNHVHIQAIGATIRPMPGTIVDPLIVYGAPVGQRLNSCRWTGGELVGNVTIQNLSYSKLDFDGIWGGRLMINADQTAAYDTICGAPAITANLMKPDACINAIHVTTPQMSADAPQAIISVPNGSATWQPGLWIFDGVCFEGTNGIMFECPGNVEMVCRDCFWQWSTLQAGTLGAGAKIVLVRPHGNIDALKACPQVTVEH